MKINKENFSKEIPEAMYDKFLATLRRHLLDGNKVAFKNIGTFSTVRKPSKKMMVGGVMVDTVDTTKIVFKRSRNFKPTITRESLMDKVVSEMTKNK